MWLAQYITENGEDADWVIEPLGLIEKVTLTFVAKFFWLLVSNIVSPTKADNVLTWDMEVLVEALVAGFDIDLGG